MGISVRCFTQRCQESCCRLNPSGERTGLLSTIVSFNAFHVYRNIGLNWPRTLPYFHFFLNRDIPCSCVERPHRFGGICCFHHQGFFSWEDRIIVFYQNIRCHVQEDQSRIFYDSLRTLTLISSLHLALRLQFHSCHIPKEPNIDLEQWWGVLSETR